jgi:hypothetical protein
MVDAVLEEVIDLRTEPSPSERVIRIAIQSDRATILHRHDPRASVRAVVRTRTANSRERQRGSHGRASLGRTASPGAASVERQCRGRKPVASSTAPTLGGQRPWHFEGSRARFRQST